MVLLKRKVLKIRSETSLSLDYIMENNFILSKTTHHMSINAKHFRSHSEIEDFRWMGGIIIYRDNNVVFDTQNFTY